MPYNLGYDIGMNGGNPGATQWFKLRLTVYEDGNILIQNTLDNDVVRGWSGSYRLDLHDLRDNALLFRIDSPVYKIGPKSLFNGQHVMQNAPDLNVNVAQEIAQRFIAHPSVYGVKLAYEEGEWLFTGSDKLAEQLGQAAVTVFAA